MVYTTAVLSLVRGQPRIREGLKDHRTNLYLASESNMKILFSNYDPNCKCQNKQIYCQ